MVVIPILEWNGFVSSVNGTVYSFIVASIVLIAAGGYVINDIFDMGIDGINKPGKNRIGTALKRSHAMILYVFLTLTGLGFALLSGILSGINYILLINLICAGLLYFYSSSYKKMFLVGNIVISFLTGVAIYSSVLYDKHALLSEPIIRIVTAYSIFAFAMSMIREIIKDCEDVAGDQAFGASTLALVAGPKRARLIASFLTLSVITALGYIQFMQQQWENLPAFIYICLFVQLPLLYLVYRATTSKSVSDDRFSSRLSKIIMLTGILSMPVFYFTSL